MAKGTTVKSRTFVRGGTVNTVLSTPIGSGNTFGKAPKATKAHKFPTSVVKSLK